MDSLEVDGPSVRRLRQQRRVPIADLAQQVGISRAYLTQIELGHRPRVSFRVLTALESALKVRNKSALRIDSERAS